MILCTYVPALWAFLPQKVIRASPEEDSLLRRLDEALSEEEIRRMVASSLLVLDDASRKRLLARSQKAAVPAAGKGKLRQEWDRLWQEWNRIIDESGAEHGDYVHQDADWEPPYIDTYSIGLDLPRSTKSTPQQPASCARAGRPSTTSNATSGAASPSGAFRFHPVSEEPAPQRRDGWIRRGSVATHFGTPLGDFLADLVLCR